ncbi:MAG: amino acid adenylation domain-containing protein, partial [Rhodospirillaceae bacterium]|nr:amino acid adenylation domain-containing protein [Rhodospirillaceae bacterium]
PPSGGVDYARMYRTGDLCRRRKDGVYLFLGRRDGQVKIRGHRVEPAEIAHRAMEHPGLAQAIVRAINDGTGQKRLCLYAVPAAGIDPARLEEGLRGHLGQVLPFYMLPADYVFLKEMPQGLSGKIDVRALPLPESKSAPFVPPKGAAEETLAGLWRAQFNRPRIGRDDNFFELGGDSIAALMLSAGLKAKGYALRARDIFDAPILHALAARLEPITPHGAAKAALPIPQTPAPDDAALKARFGNALRHSAPPLPIQLGMLIQRKLHQDRDMYVEQSLLAIDGLLDADALKARFFRLVDRHESLRSVLVETGLTAPRLAVLDAVPEDAFTILDLSRNGLTDEAVTEKLDEDAVKERLALADVARPPLMRLRLYRLSERRFRLLVSVHHLIFDGWSGGIFFSELFAEIEPEGPALPFRAVIAHRAQQDDGAAKRFWRGYLDGIEERTGIPGLVQIPDASFQDARHPLIPPPEMRQRLTRLAETTRTTVNLLLEAAWAVVLSRANRQSDILFGRVVSGRPQELDGMAGIIGPCINTVPVRARCQPERCFTDLVCQMRDDALTAEAHVWLPLTDIQAQSPLRTDLFGHFFVMESYPAPRARNGLHIAEIGEFSRTGFDVAIAWEMRDSFLTGSLIYNAAALPGWQAESLGTAYLDLLDAVLADPERPLAAYPLLSPSAQARLLRDQAPERITVTDDDVVLRIADRAARQPDAIALICGEDHLSYAELDAASTRLAARLYAHRPDADRDPARPPVVAVLLDRSADFTVSLLAILKAGAVFLPLDPDIPAERLAFCLAEAAPFAVLTQRRHTARIPAAIPCLMTDDAAPTPPAAGFAPIANAPDDPAYLIYTSGTTGTPKGVLVSHRALTNQTLWSRRRYAIGPHSRITHFAAHAFDVSLWEVLPCLVGGGTLHVLTDALRHNPEKLHAYVAAQGITDLWLPPHLAALYLESYSVAGLSSLTAGGDVFTPRTIKDPGPDFHLFNNYGPTECAVTATSHKFRPGDCVTIGQPVDNTPCYVLDENGHLQPLGFPGELCIGGPQLAIGYLNDAARTAEKFVADPFEPTPGARMYRTGDECRFLSGGQIAILGRLDQQVKIRGYRLELGEVEKALLRSPLLSRCVAAPRMDGSTGVLRLLAWAIPAEGAPQSGLERAALAEAAHWLPAYMMPDALILVDGFPLSVSGKIRTADLPDPPREQDKARARRSPETPEQIGLARTVQEVLGIAGIGLDDDFFALGGDSIKALALIASLERQGFSITLSDVFRHPVIEDLARQLQLQSPAPSSATIRPRTPAIPAKDERILVKRYARQGVEHVLPLTPMQAGMLFDMRHGEAANRHAYWIENRAELQGPLSTDAVETRLYELTARHEALRLVVVEDGLSAPAQAVLRHKDAAFAATDLSGLTADEQDAAIARACAETRTDPPCLDQDPLLRVLLFRRGPDSHAMAVFWHHIALDGWSLSLLLGELFAPELPLDPAPGFSRHLHRLAARHPAAELEWWQEKLAGGPAAAVIAAAETPAPTARDASLDFVSRTLDRHSDARLRAFARQRRCTPASVLMTAWGLLLSRYNDAEDVVFVFLSSGREPAEADIVGPCITLAPLRLSCPYDATFSQLVGETHDGLAQALAHDGCPAADLRRLAGAGFGDALFVMENQPPIETDGTLTVVPGGGFGANGVGVAAEWRDDGRLRLILHYDPARYGRQQMDALAEHHLILLEDALVRPETPSGALDLIGPAERLRLLKSCNDTKREWPETSAVDLFLAAAARHPDRPALEGTDAAYSYASLRDTAAAIAVRLREQGVRPGVPVGILLPRSADYVLAELAVMLAGGAFVPLNPDDPPSRLAAMLAQCGAAGVILEPGSSGHPCLDGENAPAGFPLDRLKTPLAPDAAPELSPPSPHDPAYILYTSGSTGAPKGVVIAQRGLANLCHWFAQDHHTGPDDAFSLYAPFIFDASVYEAFPALACGASLHVVPEEIRLEEEELADFFRDRAISVAFLPPIVGKSLLAGRRFPHLRIVTFAGDRPGALTPQPFTLMNCYGPTEFTVCATFWPVTEASEAPPIGAPIANAHAHVLDSRGRLMPFGAAGELCLSGVPLALGYANLPDRTAAAFVPNPFAAGDPDYALMYRSGDLCRRAFDGTLEFLGRLDRQIKLRGRRLEPEEIEQALRRHPAVDEAVVLPVRQGTADILRAFVTVTPGPAPNAALLLDGLAGSLPDWMIPGDIRILPSLPLTTNGKIDRDALAALEPDEPEHMNGASPLGEGPALLARLWGETLGRDAGGDRSFFALGGDSIKAMHLVSRLRAQGWRLTTRQIFSLQTLDRLSAVLEPVETGPHRAAGPESILPSLPTPDDSERRLIQTRLDGMGRIEAIFPPTPMQENLLAYRALNPSSPAYLEQSRLTVQGPLTAEQVRGRLKNAARRHAALRSVFVQTGVRRPWLVVLGDHFPAFSQTDLSHLPPKDQDAALDAALRAVRDAGMDPERGPLLRLDLCRLGPDRHALLVSFHHIILDGWSMGLLLREILASIAPRTPAPDFSAYAAWLAGTGRQEAAAWWRHYLDGATPSALCPAARTDGRAYDNRALSAILDETLCDGLRHLAAETGVTMNSLIQTGWAIVLARHDDREDALFGTVLSGRAAPVPGIEEMVGLLVRTVPVRVSCPDSASVRAVLRIVQDNAALLEDRSILPLTDILKATPHGADLIRSLFVFENLPEADMPDGYAVSAAPGFNQTPYALTLVVESQDRRLCTKLNYDGAVLDDSRAAALLDRLAHVLARMAAAPDAPLGAIGLLDERGEDAILAAALADPVRPIPSDEPQDVVALFRRAALANPDACALAANDARLSYETVRQSAHALAQNLAERGIGPGAVVAIMLERSAETIIAMLGVLEAGAAYMIIDPGLPRFRRDFLLKDCAAALLLATAAEPNKGCGIPVFSPDAAFARAPDAPDIPLPGADPGRAAYLVYTSGSTGEPKGVLVEHGALANFCHWHREFYGVTGQDVMGHVFAFAFDASAWGIFPILAAGGCIHILLGEDRARPERMRDYFDAHGVTLANIPALFMERMQALPAPRALRLLTSGGDAPRAFTPQPYAVFNEYGPSEATVMCTCHPPQTGEFPIPIGRAIAGAWCLVLDRGGRLQPFGVTGELHIAGPLLAQGYWRRPGETKKSFIPNPFAARLPDRASDPGAYARLYRTGDLCRMRPDGVLEFLGRRDTQLSVRGHRVEASEVEQALLALDGIVSAAVMLCESPGGSVLTAYVVPQALPAGQPGDAITHWREALARNLPAYMRPDAFVLLDALPLTANGKLDRAALPAPDFLAGSGRGGPARKPVELALAGLWQEILPGTMPGLDDDFFAQGGDS